MDGKFGRRDNNEESWSNYHQDRQHISYQSGEESDSTWSKQAHRKRFRYLREQVADGKMNMEHYRTENQIADIMTKGVHVKVFRRLRAMINVDSFDTMN